MVARAVGQGGLAAQEEGPPVGELRLEQRGVGAELGREERRTSCGFGVMFGWITERQRSRLRPKVRRIFSEKVDAS